MLQVAKGELTGVAHTSALPVAKLGTIEMPAQLASMDWLAAPMHGQINLGPFSVEYDLNINTHQPLESFFHVKVSVDTHIPFVGRITLIDAHVDKDNAQVGFSEYGFTARVTFDIDDLELYVEAGAFGHTWKYVIWKA